MLPVPMLVPLRLGLNLRSPGPGASGPPGSTQAQTASGTSTDNVNGAQTHTLAGCGRSQVGLTQSWSLDDSIL